MREFEALEENRLFVKGEHLERMGPHLMSSKASRRFPHGWLKMSVSPKYPTLLLIGWTIGGRRTENQVLRRSPSFEYYSGPRQPNLGVHMVSMSKELGFKPPFFLSCHNLGENSKIMF